MRAEITTGRRDPIRGFGQSSQFDPAAVRLRLNSRKGERGLLSL